MRLGTERLPCNVLRRAAASVLTHYRLLHEEGSGSMASLLSRLANYEQQGVPAGAGTQSAKGFDLSRMESLLDALGKPQTSWQAVHVAGTKGKGSTAALLAGILTKSGYNVGLYTSPHILTLRERIAVNGVGISQAELDSLAVRHGSVVEVASSQSSRNPVTHFEALTALAFKHFQEQQVDIAVVEAGLGGVRDATNVFDSNKLALSIITPISFEHAAALGGSLSSIAAAKAGIMKPGRPAVIAPQPESEAADVLHRAAADLNVAIREVAAEVEVEAGGELQEEHDSFLQPCTLRVIGSLGESLPARAADARLRMLGEHQLGNAGTAVTAALELRRQGLHRITLDTIVEGIQSAYLLGRIQVSRLPPDAAGRAPWLVLDGAHTPNSAAMLARTLRAAFPRQPIVLVLAMADDKDYRGVAAALLASRPQAVIFTTVPIAGELVRSAPPGTLAAQWQVAEMSQGAGPRVRTRHLIQASMRVALEQARRELTTVQGEHGVLCVCGSLHAVGDALAALEY